MPEHGPTACASAGVSRGRGPSGALQSLPDAAPLSLPPCGLSRCAALLHGGMGCCCAQDGICGTSPCCDRCRILLSPSLHTATCCRLSLLSTAHASPTGHATMARPSSTCSARGRHDSSAECSGRRGLPHCSGIGPPTAHMGDAKARCCCRCPVTTVGATWYASTNTAAVCASAWTTATGSGTCRR